MYLREIAAAKSGDKGNTSNVSVFPYDENDYEFLRRVLTVEVVKEHFGDLVRGPIRRYVMPGIKGPELRDGERPVWWRHPVALDRSPR